MLSYIDQKGNAQDDYLNLNHAFEHMKILEDPHQIKSIFYLLAKIVDNHHRCIDFFKKIEQIFLLFKDVIPKFFTNSEIFNIFKGNKRVILTLFEMNLLTIDQSIALAIAGDQFKSAKYIQYFYPEIKPFLDDITFKDLQLNLDEKFADKRKNEDNENEICKLILNNKVDEFESYVKKQNIELTQLIKPSIFNTSSFLNGKMPSLIEYAAFCGSFQIFNYLYVNHVQIPQTIWVYAIHGGNLDIIHLLETCKVKPLGDSYLECLIKAVKCHENELATYILQNLLHKHDKIPKEISMKSLKFFNFEFIDEKIIEKSIFYDLCEYGHYTLVKILLDTDDVDVNTKRILNLMLFNTILAQFIFI